MTRLGGRWPWPGMLGVVLLIAGAVSNWPLLEHIGLTLIGLLAVCLPATWLSAWALSARGHATMHAVTAGEHLVVRYLIRNRAPWPVIWTLLRPQGFSLLPVEGQLVALPPRTRRQIDVSLLCPRRGCWPAGGWSLQTGDPFGFFGRLRAGPGSDMIVVYPRPLPLPNLVLPAPPGRAASPRGRAAGEPSAMVREVRPYRPGDLSSRVHWLSTARLDTLMVREPEAEPVGHTWLVLDLDAGAQYGDEDEDSVELVVGAGSFLVQQQARARIPTGLLVVGPDTVVRQDQQREHSERLQKTLALAEPGACDVARSLSLLPPSARWGAIIVVTPWADERWSARLAALAHAGCSVLCILVQPPESANAETLDAQAAALDAVGVRVYRYSGWAA